MPWLIMSAGTVHMLPLSWQNQSPRAVNVYEQVADTLWLTERLLMFSSPFKYKHAHSETEKNVRSNKRVSKHVIVS